ncbi:hypothetical protein BDR03DRAFT_969843 [Suillus americanus]|nr:hypothetical protein BDR03DRAFT_969843 [Suillus americanus]
MKGFLSLVLVSIAILHTTAAAPTASEHFQAVEKREGEQNVEKRNYVSFKYLPDRIYVWPLDGDTDGDADAALDDPEA